MMKKKKSERAQLPLLVFSIVLMTFGIMFLLTAAEIIPIFEFLYNIENVLGSAVR